jgi:hypothetical protein
MSHKVKGIPCGAVAQIIHDSALNIRLDWFAKRDQPIKTVSIAGEFFWILIEAYPVLDDLFGCSQYWTR